MTLNKDIFISYAHHDNQLLPGDKEGWVTEFHKALEVMVGEYLGKVPVIWRDSKLQGNDMFSDEITEKFQELKVMISVISPRYLESEWCTKEVNGFYDIAQTNGGISIENKARIFKIIKTPVELKELPERLKPILAYEFFSTDTTTGTTRAFKKIFGNESEVAFWTKMDEVAQHLAKLIKKLNSASTQIQVVEKSATVVNDRKFNKRTIYLAETTSDVREFRDNLRRELEDHGFRIFPDKNLTLVDDAFKKEVEEYLKQSSLSLHIIGSKYGTIPEDSDKSILLLQNEAAAAQGASAGLSRLIWVPPIDNPAEERLKPFIEHLKQKEDLQNLSDLLVGSQEDFKHAIFDTIRKLDEHDKAVELARQKAKAAPVANNNAVSSQNSGPRVIYLICDKRDLENTKDLEDYLFGCGYDVMLPIFESDEAEERKINDEYLSLCDAAVIYYGQANEAWLRSRSSDLARKPGLPNSKPLLAKLVYLAEPSTPQKERFRSHDLMIANGLNGLNKDNFNAFIDSLK
ncbi:MAG: toll/interleukin-1 receptor domain-containing protein [Bacteroidetes bacterium]|nr:toll/interleukin-1 receptor domain-containing protein [Bacteroidota bacterium]